MSQCYPIGFNREAKSALELEEMQSLLKEIQTIWSDVNKKTALDKILASHGWTDDENEVGTSGYRRRTRVHPTLGEWDIEICGEGSQERVEIFPVDCDGYALSSHGRVVRSSDRLPLL